MKECVYCTKFWTCRDSVVAFWEAQKKYPTKTANDAVARAEYMKEQFKECQEYVKA